MIDKMVIINGKEVYEATTWGEINQALQKAISDLCVNQRATKAIIVQNFGITPSMCNKPLFTNYGCRNKRASNKKVKKSYVTRSSQKVVKSFSYYPKNIFSKRPHKFKKRGQGIGEKLVSIVGKRSFCLKLF